MTSDNPRFYIDHGVIHDRVTGKHVVTDGQPPFEDSVEQVCELLNGLAHAAFEKLEHDQIDRMTIDEIADAVS